MQLHDILYSQGFGTRRVCMGLVQQGRVALFSADGASEQVCLDPFVEVETQGLEFSVDGVRWSYHAKAYVLLHKPAGFECSQRPSAHPSVYTLLPAPLRQRPVKGGVAGVQAVGRLDQDTTGLLLLSDDGKFIHRMASPRRRVPKVYRVTARHTFAPDQLRRLLQGVVLDDDPRPVQAVAVEALDDRVIELALTEGRYHQVKRMVAAVGNRVEALHRVRIGGLALPEDLPEGQWRWLQPADLALLAP